MSTIGQRAAAAFQRLSSKGKQETREAIAKGVGTAMGSDNLAIASSRALSASEREAAAAAISGLVQARGLKPESIVNVNLQSLGNDVRFDMRATRWDFEGPIKVHGVFDMATRKLKELSGLSNSGVHIRTAPFFTGH